jgi:ATP-dependent DNA ligase
VFFDVLAAGGEDHRGRSYDDRRRLLERLAQTWTPQLALSPVTSDAGEAGEWVKDMAAV